jgi:hypothetical protein
MDRGQNEGSYTKADMERLDIYTRLMLDGGDRTRFEPRIS